MSKVRRKWSAEQKLQIIQEAGQHGTTETLRKHHVSQSLFYRWKLGFDNQGLQGLQPRYATIDPEVKQLQPEMSGSSGSLPTRHWSWSSRANF